MAHGLDVYFISEDTSRSEFDFIIPLFNQLYKLGVDKIIITDTIGVMLPAAMQKFVTKIINSCNANIKFGIHCHNDFGLATANTLAAIEAGIVYPTATVNGIGERAGNASFEEVVLTLESIYKYNTGITLSKITELSQMVERFSGMPVAPNKPIVGYNSFRHESGIHVNSMLKNINTYEPISPETVGRQREYVIKQLFFCKFPIFSGQFYPSFSATNISFFHLFLILFGEVTLGNSFCVLRYIL